MGLSADAYLAELQALLPSGKAWTTEPNAVMTQVLAAICQEFARIDARADALLLESNPLTATELLPDYERVFGLPDACIAATALTISQRRTALAAKMSSVDDLTKQFFIDLAAGIGYTVTIDQNVDGSPFKWRVNSSGVAITSFLAGSAVAGDPLRRWGNQMLECTINRYVPAHTQVLFAYLTIQPASIPSAESFGTPTII